MRFSPSEMSPFESHRPLPRQRVAFPTADLPLGTARYLSFPLWFLVKDRLFPLRDFFRRLVPLEGEDTVLTFPKNSDLPLLKSRVMFDPP